MPRVAEARPAAEPVSPNQHARRRRILHSAAVLGARHGLDRVQMHEVAKEADVAIATLYRYFPSKTHLFSSVMAAQVDALAHEFERPPGKNSVEAVGDVLVRASRLLLATPLLAQAMIQSNIAAQAETRHTDAAFHQLLLTVLGVQEPTVEEMTPVRLVAMCWYGLLQQALNGLSSLSEVESDIHIACRLLLGPRFAQGDDDRNDAGQDELE